MSGARTGTPDRMREVYDRFAQRGRPDDSQPCASGAHCVTDPATRVAYRGDVCAGCRGVRERMARTLRERKR